MTPPALELRPLPEQPRAEQRALLALRNEPEVRHNMYDGDLIEPATHERWLDGIAANRRADYHLVYLDDTLIGMVAFTNIDQTQTRRLGILHHRYLARTRHRHSPGTFGTGLCLWSPRTE